MPTLSLPRTTGAWLAAPPLLAVLAWLSHRLTYGQFQQYDDEGYLLVTVQQFLQGLPLYDDVYTQYGPAYYLWQLLLHGAIGIPTTHDATRLVTILVWLVCSVLAAVPVWLLTGRPVLTLFGVVIAFFHLTQLTFEPGHPQELCLLAITSGVAMAVWRLVVYGHLGMPAVVAIGGLLALTLLTKVNVGGFLAGALTLAAVISLRRSPGRIVLSKVVAFSAMAAVPALTYRELLRPDIAAWVIVVWSALFAAYAADSAHDTDEGVVTSRELMAGVVTVAAVSLAVISIIVGKGTSLRALTEGLFVWPLDLATVFWRPLPVPIVAAAVAPLWVLAAVLSRRQQSAIRRHLPSMSLLVGQIMCFLSILKAYGLLLAFAPPLAWLLLRNPSIRPEERAARRVLTFTAILMALQAYPMPEGTQMALSTVLLVPAALVIVADAERALRPDHGLPPPLRSLGQRATLAIFVIVVTLIVGISIEGRYARATPIAMPGAEAIRSTERDAATYRWLTANIREHCDAFVSAPGFNSLHFWTGLRPLSPLNTTLWPILFDHDQQARVLRAAAPVQRVCVPWEPSRMAYLTSGAGVASRPLVAWLTRGFEPRGSFGGWEFRVHRGRQLTLVYQGRRLEGGEILLELPALGPHPMTRLVVVNVDAEQTVVDSLSSKIALMDEDGALAPIAGGIDLSKPRRLIVDSAEAGVFSDHGSLVIRLLSRDGRLLAVVPLVTDVSTGASPQMH